jgi:DNA-binding NarL/FixJ family response regulator
MVHVLTEAGFEVVGIAGDARDLVRKTRAHTPDVVVTDIQMPPHGADDGLHAACEIRASQPDVGVLVLSQFLEGRYAFELLGNRAERVGYLLKDRVGDVRTFVEAVRRVAGGGTVLDAEVVSVLVGHRDRRRALGRLSTREREVLELMAAGRSNRGIAEVMCVTVPAVERHITSIFAKLGLRQATDDHRRVLAVIQFLRR